MAKNSVNMYPWSWKNHVHSLRPGLPYNGFHFQVYPELRAVLLVANSNPARSQI